MKVVDTAIPEVKIIAPAVYGDHRGYFSETFTARWFEQNVFPAQFVQDNESCSSQGVVRGLHFQKSPSAQGKLVRVVRGKVLDVAVDIRRGSPTFGRHIAVELSGENHLQLFIPRGFAHGFSVLEGPAVLCYKCDSFYNAADEQGIIWNDPDLAIEWKVDSESAVLSGKDVLYPRLKDAPWLFDYGEKLY